MQGCTLPEETRLAYLDAMGVTCWQLQHVEQEGVEEPAQVLPAADVRRPASIDADSPADWSQLEQAVAACERCAELCQSRTQTVFGTGNRDADLLVIGEAPGKDEDQQGEPFVGRAGQLLTAMLKAIDLERDTVFIANVLKCRPPNNRDPSPDEVSNCNDFLRQQIELIKPKGILVVGRIAAQNLLSTDTPVGKLRGQQFEYDGIPLLVTYHPAYLLRKPTEKRKSWQDLLQLKSLMATWQ